MAAPPTRLGKGNYAPFQEDCSHEDASETREHSSDHLKEDESCQRDRGTGPTRLFVYMLSINAALGGFLFGYDTGVVSGAMLQIRTARQGLGDLTPGEQELIVSSTIAGAVVGSLFSGEAQKRFWMGRRSAILLGSALFVAGAAMMGVAWDVASLTAGRVVVGVAVGIVSHACPLYISECAPADLRGTLNTLNTASLVLGQVVASLVCCAFARQGTPQGWRWMLGVGGLPAVLMSLGFLVLPESPRYLVLCGRGSDTAVRQAEAVLRRLRGPEDAGGVGEELRAAVQSLAENGGSAASLCGAFRSPGVRRALLLGCGLQLLQQLCGINTIMYYSATILQMSSGEQDMCARGAAHQVPRVNKQETADVGTREICLTALVAASQLFGTMLGMFLVDRSGRRPLVLGSLCGVSFSLFALGVAFHPGTMQAASSAPIWVMVVYLLFFGIGMAPLPWVVNAEIYPLQARSVCIGIATASNWVANFLVAATFLDLAEALSTDPNCPTSHPDGAFWLYGLVAVMGLACLAKWMPETKGLSLEEISALFEGRAKSRDTSSSSTLKEVAEKDRRLMTCLLL